MFKEHIDSALFGKSNSLRSNKDLPLKMLHQYALIHKTHVLAATSIIIPVIRMRGERQRKG